MCKVKKFLLLGMLLVSMTVLWILIGLGSKELFSYPLDVVFSTMLNFIASICGLRAADFILNKLKEEAILEYSKKAEICDLLKEKCGEDKSQLEWLVKNNFVNIHPTNHFYYTKQCKYLGDNTEDEIYWVLREAIDNIDYNEFMTKFNEEFGDKENG